MEINTSKSISKITYEDVDVSLVGGTDMLQARVDATGSCKYLFAYYTASEMIDISRLDTSNVTDISYMFCYCNNLTTLNLSNINTTNVTSMTNIFMDSSKITTLDLSNFNTSKVKGMGGMFRGCRALTSVNLSSFDTSNVTDMAYMFSGCYALSTIDLTNFNTKNVTNMDTMFDYCKSLVTLDLSSFNTSNVTNMWSAFRRMDLLENIIGIIDMVKVTNTRDMFSNSYALKEVTLKNIKVALQIGSGTTYGHLLTLDTLINTIKELWDYSGGSTTYKLTIGSANLEKIANVYVKLITPTEEQIAADPNITSKKPCVVCDSTEEGAMLLNDYALSKNWIIQ